ncbi:MAG: response regulator, partial [Limnobacter sp.]|nr:response regulator [Limnobacter sp.]
IQWGMSIDQLDELNLHEAQTFSDLYLKDSIIIADTRLRSIPISAQKAILEFERRSLCKIVLISGHSDHENHKWIRKEWQDSVLTRPISQDVFFRTLSQLGSKRRRINEASLALVAPEREQFKGRILIAEDVPLNQKILKQTLEKFGVEVVCANDGNEALEKLVTGSFDLIFMDCQMPGMDGYEATRRIREGSVGLEHSDIPVVALTAHSMVGDDKACMEAGMSQYMSKPVNATQIGEVLKKWLKPRPGQEKHS